MTGRRNGWYIVETANVHWPGALPWRGLRAAEEGKAYATEEAAIERARVVNAHYNARFGRGLPLAVRRLEAARRPAPHRTVGPFHTNVRGRHSIVLGPRQTKRYENRHEDGDRYRRALRAAARARANQSGKPIEIFAHEGYVLTQIEPDRDG